MEETQLIEKRIKKIPRQKIFSAESICRDSSIKNVKHVLNRLKKRMRLVLYPTIYIIDQEKVASSWGNLYRQV